MPTRPRVDALSFDLDGTLIDTAGEIAEAANRAIAEFGLPAQRPLFLHHANDAALYAVQDQYLYGADLLVAPVIEEGAIAREVILPGEGEWVHAFTGTAYAPGTHTIAAPIGTPPVFYRPDSAFADLFAGLRAL